MKRRRMRQEILSQSKGREREEMMQRGIDRKEMRRRKENKINREEERELDDDEMFYENAKAELKDLDMGETVSPTPNRCVFVDELIEVCLNDEHLEIIKLVQK